MFLRRHPKPALAMGVLLCLLAGCSVRRMAVNALADELSSSTGSAFSKDDDLVLVGDALPFALKLLETLLDAAPDHPGLHLALASGFTQYAVVMAQFPAERVKYDDFPSFRAGLERARRLLVRARGYGLEGLDLAHPGFSVRVLEDPEGAMADTSASDVALLYWTGAAWLSEISLSKELPEAIGQLPTAAGLLHRALALQEDWDRGAIHEALISLEPSLPEPGGNERARAHFARAVELSAGRRASPYVALATSVSVAEQDRAEFESLLEQALAVEPVPEEALAHAYAVERATWLLDHVDDLFLGSEDR
ncbi:MAG: hypothetical protein JXB39_10890 [Deltaproteobacteria bacterium]|nr:hypothetical protein [Deltaproteobacteria bacterium]